jgi:golgi to ER traffic protein 4
MLDDPHTAAIYASRAVFPFLLTGSLRNANKAFLIFTMRLSSSKSTLVSQEISSTSLGMRVYPSLPLLNFISLLLLAIQRGTPNLLRELTDHYAVHIQEVGIWDDALTRIAETYFGMKVPKQSNPLLDMMGSVFFGGGQGRGNQRPGSQLKGSSMKAEASLSSMELD